MINEMAVLNYFVEGLKSEKYAITRARQDELTDFKCLAYDRSLSRNGSVPYKSDVSEVNQTMCFVCRGSDHIYYILGKLNVEVITESPLAGIYVYYQEGLSFNPVKIKYIYGGILKDDEILTQIYRVCVMPRTQK